MKKFFFTLIVLIGIFQWASSRVDAYYCTPWDCDCVEYWSNLCRLYCTRHCWTYDQYGNLTAWDETKWGAYCECCTCGSWSNDVCGGGSCSSEQMHQVRTCSPAGCDVESRCVDDTCTSWTDQSCGGDACLPSQMYQTRDCTYNCKAEERCDDRTLGSPTPVADPTCGNEETVFDFSWSVPDSSTCPVEPIQYSWKVDDASWSPFQLELTTSAGPFSQGSHIFYVKAKDDSGRESSPGSVSFSVDTIGPDTLQPTYSPVCGVASGDTVTFSWDPVSDEGCASGNIQYSFKIDDDPWSAWQTETSTTWVAETGEHIFYVKAKDGVGNESGIGYITIGVDCFDGPTIDLSVDECSRANKRRPYWYWTATPVCAASLRETDTYYIWLDDDPTEGVHLVPQGFQTENFFQPSSDLADGYYTLRVRAYDACDQYSDAEVEAFVDGTPPVFTAFSCVQGTGPDDLDSCCSECVSENYVGFSWTAEDQGAYPSGLREENTYYWYANFPPWNGYTTDTSWGPQYIRDSIAPNPNKFYVLAFDACGNAGSLPPAWVPNLYIDTHPPISNVELPPDGSCFGKDDIFEEFTGTVKDESCFGVKDLDIWIEREKDNFCWDGSEWKSAISCPIYLDTDLNDLDPPIDDGETLDWSRANDLPWPDDSSADGNYRVCSVGEDGQGQRQGATDVCHTFVYDNTLPTCGNTIELSDAETGSWITTSTENVLVQTAGFWDKNCVKATYSARILRNGVKIWPEGADWYVQEDTICTTTGGYPNNHYVFQGLPPEGTVDGDQLELCFDVIDCAGHKASENSVEDCPILEEAPNLCKTITIFSPAWFQVGSNVHVNSTVSKSIFTDIPFQENPNPYFSLSKGVVSSGGGMDFGLGSVGENVGKLENYSGALYQVDKKDYNYFWQLFGQPSSAPPLKGNTSDPCNDGEEIEGMRVCYNSSDLTIESKPNPLEFKNGRKALIFVNGNLQIDRKIRVEKGSLAVFVVKGDLNISWDLESTSVDDPILEGIYIVDGRIYSARIARNAGKECIYDEETGYSDPSTCEFDHNNDPDFEDNLWPGKRLVAKGMFISWGGFWLTPPYGRNLKGCTETRLICNKNTPAELFLYRPDLFQNLPPVFKEQSISWEEVAP